MTAVDHLPAACPSLSAYSLLKLSHCWATPSVGMQRSQAMLGWCCESVDENGVGLCERHLQEIGQKERL